MDQLLCRRCLLFLGAARVVLGGSVAASAVGGLVVGAAIGVLIIVAAIGIAVVVGAASGPALAQIAVPVALDVEAHLRTPLRGGHGKMFGWDKHWSPCDASRV